MKKSSRMVSLYMKRSNQIVLNYASLHRLSFADGHSAVYAIDADERKLSKRGRNSRVNSLEKNITRQGIPHALFTALLQFMLGVN